jgi:hypothetical protein
MLLSQQKERKQNMKKTMMMVVGLVAGLCVTAHAGYKTETSVVPGPEANQYVIQITITDVKADGKTEVLSAPAMTVEVNKAGKITVADEKEENGYFCTAMVTEIKGVLTATTTVVVKEKGAEVLNTAQSMKLMK